jgi:hypothetical protein
MFIENFVAFILRYFFCLRNDDGLDKSWEIKRENEVFIRISLVGKFFLWDELVLRHFD